MKTVVSFLLLLMGVRCYAQDTPVITSATNPIVFAEIFVGSTRGYTGGLAAGVSLNYQTGKNLLTLRHTGTSKLRGYIASPWIPIPIIEQKSALSEFALMYGRRFVNESSAYSFSIGISRNKWERKEKGNNSPEISAFTGVPFEANIKWFARNKKRMRIYFIPVGKPTAFGAGIGVKLFGNMARNGFYGAAIVYSLGYHRHY